MRWDQAQWRKLYCREEGRFALLPLYARALAAELLKFCDDRGRIFVGSRSPWEAIAKMAGAEIGERRLLRKHLPQLIESGYIERSGDYIAIVDHGDLVARRGTPSWSKSAYAEVYARDGRRCRYCASTESLSVDHVIPRAQGGSDAAENLAIACRGCNSRKGGRTPAQAGMTLRSAGGGR